MSVSTWADKPRALVKPGTFVRTIMEDADGDRFFTPWIRAEYPDGIEHAMIVRMNIFGWRPLYRLRVTYPKPEEAE